MIPYLEQSSEDQKRGSIYQLDSHVDTNYASKHARIIEVIEDRSCDFHPLNEDYYTLMKKIQYVHGMLSTYSTLVELMSIKLTNALDFTDTMENNVLCTNQTRENRVEINNVPTKQNDSSKFDVNFVEEKMYAPLQMNGPTPYTLMIYPTKKN